MTALETLTQARKLIDKPQKWMRQAYTNDKGRYSASGAILKVLEGTGDFDKAFLKEHPAGNALRRVTPKEFERLDDFNDQATHEEVLALFDKAIAQLKK